MQWYSREHPPGQFGEFLPSNRNSSNCFWRWCGSQRKAPEEEPNPFSLQQIFSNPDFGQSNLLTHGAEAWASAPLTCKHFGFDYIMIRNRRLQHHSFTLSKGSSKRLTQLREPRSKRKLVFARRLQAWRFLERSKRQLLTLLH